MHVTGLIIGVASKFHSRAIALYTVSALTKSGESGDKSKSQNELHVDVDGVSCSTAAVTESE